MMKQERFTEQAQEVLAAICHPERSEGSKETQILRCAQNDKNNIEVTQL